MVLVNPGAGSDTHLPRCLVLCSERCCLVQAQEISATSLLRRADENRGEVPLRKQK